MRAAWRSTFFELTQVFIDIFPIHWTGAAGNFGSGEWADSGNWCCLGPQQVPDSKFVEVVFDTLQNAVEPVIVNNSAAVTVKSISFRSLDEYRITGTGKINLESDDLTARIILSAGAHQIRLPIALINKTVAFTDNGTRLDIAGPLDFVADGRTLTINGGGRIDFNDSSDLPAMGNVINNAQVGGSGRINASLTNQAGGTVLPGNSVGTLTIDGDFTQDAAATLGIELGGAVPGTFDRLVVGGNSALDGTLHLSLIDGFVPGAGDSFEILSAASVTGAFANAPGGVLNTAFGQFLVTYSGTGVTLSPFLVEPIPGDYNIDGIVDAADYIVWRDHLTTNAPLPNEGASIGVVDQDDYGVWQANFGKTASFILNGVAAVPSDNFYAASNVDPAPR